MSEVLELLLLGLGVGTVGGALGVGGGFLLIPILFTMMGWPLLPAVATSHFCTLAVSASASALNARAELIDWRMGISLEAAVVVGAASGALFATSIPAVVVAGLYAVVVFAAAVKMWRPARDGAARTGPTRWVAAPIMVVVGAIAAILGLGGGVMKVPVLTGIMNLPLRRAVATSAFMVGITGATAGGIYYLKGLVPVAATGALALGALAGAILGTAIQRRLPVLVTRRVFAVLLLALMLRVVYRVLVP